MYSQSDKRRLASLDSQPPPSTLTPDNARAATTLADVYPTDRSSQQMYSKRKKKKKRRKGGRGEGRSFQRERVEEQVHA